MFIRNFLEFDKIFMKFTRILFNIVCKSFDVDFHKMTICRQEENAFEKESVFIVVNIIVERVNPSPSSLYKLLYREISFLGVSQISTIIYF